jgi:hypothetical protein
VWDKKMLITIISAVVGVLMAGVAMIQATPLTMRFASIWVLIVCQIVFLYSFLSLGTRS